MSQTSQHFIQGRSRDASDGATMDLISPITERVHARAARGTAADIDAAVAAARAQLDGGAWSTMPGSQRAILINKLADLVERDADKIADMDASCIGRPPIEPRLLDLPNAIGTLRTSAGWADKIEGRSIPTAGYMGIKTLSYTRREPVGVVGAIVPWNTPFMITSWKVGPALAAGCALVIKPSEETPLSALHLAALCQEAGIPDGVVNVVTGVGEVVGHALCVHPGVDKITFTGSPEVGRLIQRAAGDSFKRIALELGGKSPQIVFNDASLEQAIQGCAMGLFFNQGQVCAAGSRILVQRGIADQFAKTLAGAAASIKVGDPAQAGAERDTVKVMVDQLTREHRNVESAWERLKPHLKAIAKGHDTTLDTEALTALVAHYKGHARFEEQSFLPLSKTILGRNGDHLAALGVSMHMRRAMPGLMERFGHRI